MCDREFRFGVSPSLEFGGMTKSEAKLVFFILVLIPSFDFERGKSKFFDCTVVIVARGCVGAVGFDIAPMFY